MSGGTFYFNDFFVLQDTISTLQPKPDTLAAKAGIHHAKDSLVNLNVQSKTIGEELKKKTSKNADSIQISTTKAIPIQPKIKSEKKTEIVEKPEQKDTVIKHHKISWNSLENFTQFLYHKEKKFKISEDSSGYDTLQVAEVKNQRNLPLFTSRNEVHSDWIFWTFVILAFLFVWIQVFYRKYLISLFNSIFSFQASSKLYNEKNVLARRVSLVLNFVYTISVSLIVFKIAQFYKLRPVNYDKLSFFLIILNFMILFSVIKTLLQKLIGFIFDRLSQVNEYLHNVYVVNKSLGIILIPLSFASFYTQNKITEALFMIVAGIYVLSLFLKIIRGFQIILKHDIFILYSILYLCTLEILPVLLGYKFIKSLS